MQSFGGQNTHIIQETEAGAIVNALRARGISEAHFNNGTFMLPEEKFAPAFLAAFKRVTDLVDDDGDVPLIVAINSDKSMLDSYKGKENEADLIAALVPQQNRAEMVVSLLSALSPERKVAAVFYDEDTPHNLYKTLHDAGFGMNSLHKVGYGTQTQEEIDRGEPLKPIIGAEFFDWVYACPLPFDGKPVMHGDTRNAVATDRQADVIEKLTEEIGPHGAPYITKKGELLFPVPPVLQKYAYTTPEGPAPEPKAGL